MTKPRKQIFTMDQYNKDIKDEDIRQDPDVQRVGGDQWSKEMVNELIFTTLNGDYVPPIIIGEENNSQKWIIDGLQRTTSWFIFRYGNYKITKSIEESVVNYKRKCRTEDGRIMKDEHGDIIWENAEFDIKGKTYSDLPDELKKSFNEYQEETVIHENCTMERISKLIRRYNNHVSMNSNQKAFTYVDNFARMIRDITKHTFFVNCGEYSQKSKTKGVLERVIVETIACMYHFDNWKRDVKRLNSYINKNATRVEFEKFRNNLDNLANIVTDEVKNLFTVKDSFIWFTAYNNAIESGIKDEVFGRY